MTRGRGEYDRILDGLRALQSFGDELVRVAAEREFRRLSLAWFNKKGGK